MNAPRFRPTPRPRLASSPGLRAEVQVGEDSFVPEAVLDGWLRAGDATRAGGLLVARDGRRWGLRDGLRIVGLRNGDESDPYGLTGRVESLRDFIRQGAVLAADSLRLGHAVYDVEFGVLAVPMPSPDESGPSPALNRA